MNYAIQILILHIFLLASGCKQVQKTAGRKVSDPPLIELTKGSCYGTCPVYTIRLYQDGSVVFLPKRFTAVKDTVTATWPIADILPMFASTHWDTMQQEYILPIADIPLLRLRYRDKEVKWNGYTPRELNRLMTILDFYTDESGWVIYHPVPNPDDPDPYRIGEVIIHLKQGADIHAIFERHMEYGLFFLKRITPSGEYILAGYDILAMPIDTLLTALTNDPDVVSASKNNIIQLRHE